MSEAASLNLVKSVLPGGISVTPSVLWVALVIVVVIFTFISLIFVYHWMRFGLNAKKMTAVTFIYVSGGLLLLLVMLAAAGYYQISS